VHELREFDGLQLVSPDEPSGSVIKAWLSSAMGLSRGVVRLMDTDEGKRTARQSLLTLVQLVFRVAAIVVIGWLLHILCHGFGWYPFLSHDNQIYASFLQGLLGLVALFGAYFIYLQTQAPAALNQLFIGLGKWLGAVQDHQSAGLFDAEGQTRAFRFLDAAQRVQDEVQLATVSGEPPLAGIRSLSDAAPRGFTIPPYDVLRASKVIERSQGQRFKVSIPMYGAISLALASAVLMAVPIWQTGGATIVVTLRLVSVGYQVLVFFFSA